jgi:DNA modification methylase
MSSRAQLLGLALSDKYGFPLNIVLDPFCGSGTALLAAIHLGRNFME